MCLRFKVDIKFRLSFLCFLKKLQNHCTLPVQSIYSLSTPVIFSNMSVPTYICAGHIYFRRRRDTVRLKISQHIRV
jgi:hypothetical protein